MDHMPTPEEIFGSYTSWKLTENTWIISFMGGSQFLYLLEGKEKALLIDTGYGMGHLRQYCEKLTDKPILCANTHFHPDHAAGNAEFAEVIVSEDWEIDKPTMETGEYPCDTSTFLYPDYKKVLVTEEGYDIDLGGRVIHAKKAKPAHCNSSVFFFDEGEGMLFTGDDLECAQVMTINAAEDVGLVFDPKSRLDNMRANTVWMKELCDSGKVKYLLPNHNGTPIALSYVDDFIGLIDHIYAGDATIEDKLNHKYVEMDPKSVNYCRVRYNKASIFIVKSELMKVYGK